MPCADTQLGEMGSPVILAATGWPGHEQSDYETAPRTRDLDPDPSRDVQSSAASMPPALPAS